MSIPEASDIQGDLPAAATRQGMVDRKELSAFAFQRTRMPMVVSDARQPDYPIVLANDAFLALTGYDAEEVLGRNCRFLQGEATSKLAVAQIRAAVAQSTEAKIEILNYKKDGAPFWNQLHISPLRDETGNVAYYFASQVDVTDFRRIQTLEESEHRLLADSDEAAPLFRDDCAPGFRDDLAPLRLGSCWSRLFSVYRGWESRFSWLISPQAIAG